MNTEPTPGVTVPARKSTGVAGLDEILHGGLPSGRSYLVVGGAGSGKTVLSLQWLLEGARKGERAMYITLAEPGGGIVQNAGGLGWDLGGIDLIDLSAASESIISGEYRVFAPNEVEHAHVWTQILAAVKEKRPQRLVLDSLTQLRYLSTDAYQFRKHVQGLVVHMARTESTSYFLYEPTELDREASAALAVDGIIRLQRGVSPGLGTGLRAVQIEKLRGSDFVAGLHPMRIGRHGIEVYPHRVEGPGDHRRDLAQISSGIPGVDQMLGGGLDSGATTMLTGPAGVGKSSLATHMMVQAIKAAGRAAIYTFEESIQSMALRARGMGTPVDKYLKDGSLRIVRVNPMQVYPDELLGMIRQAVENEGVSAVAVDSLRGYQLAMEEFGMAQAHIHNLIAYLNRNAVTTVLVNEVEAVGSTDLRVTDLGVSHLADTVVLMRYADSAGRTIKIINALKRRLGGFDPDIREFNISSEGLSVSTLAQRLSGVLSASPAVTRS